MYRISPAHSDLKDGFKVLQQATDSPKIGVDLSTDGLVLGILKNQLPSLYSAVHQTYLRHPEDDLMQRITQFFPKLLSLLFITELLQAYQCFHTKPKKLLGLLGPSTSSFTLHISKLENIHKLQDLAVVGEENVCLVNKAAICRIPNFSLIRNL